MISNHHPKLNENIMYWREVGSFTEKWNRFVSISWWTIRGHLWRHNDNTMLALQVVRRCICLNTDQAILKPDV